MGVQAQRGIDTVDLTEVTVDVPQQCGIESHE